MLTGMKSTSRRRSACFSSASTPEENRKPGLFSTRNTNWITSRSCDRTSGNSFADVQSTITSILEGSKMEFSRGILTVFIIGCVFSFAHSESAAQGPATTHNLMPVPASLRFNSGRLAITSSFTIAAPGHSDARLLAAIGRMTRRLEARTGLTFARGPAGDAAAATLVIRCQSAGRAIPAVDEDESFSLEVSNSQAVMNAPTVVGALRGLETFLQLLGAGADGYSIPAVSIQD